MTESREGLAFARPQAQVEEIRRGVSVRLADRVVVATMLRDNITLAEQRTRGAAACPAEVRIVPTCLWPTGFNDRVAERALNESSNPATGKGASQERSVPLPWSRTGENPPYGILEGALETSSMAELGTHFIHRKSETGNPQPKGDPRQCSTQQADFQPGSYGFRPKKSATQALEAIRVAGNQGMNFVVDADIQGYFDNIRRETLLELVKERISDRRALKLIRQWLEAGVMEDGTVRETLAGTPQGGVISPLLANIYLNKLDRIWAARCSQLGILIRYADDFVAMCGTESRAREALRRIGLVMNRLGLTLHPAKTRLVDLRRGKESFVFLGCTIRKRRVSSETPAGISCSGGRAQRRRRSSGIACES